MKVKIKFVCNVVKWYDRINGNTYHSVRITDTKNGKTYVNTTPYSYGYGEHYKQTAFGVLIDRGLIDKKYTRKNVFVSFERENDYPIMWTITDVRKKSEMIDNGTL